MRVSKQVAGELADDQHASVIDDRKVMDDFKSFVEWHETQSSNLSEEETGILRSALTLMQTNNNLLVEQGQTKGEAIKGFQGAAGMIVDLERIIGGDVDLATGFACLRTEDGDDSNDTLIFLKGEFIGQVRDRSMGGLLPGFRGMVKRDGKIDTIQAASKDEAVVSILKRNADVIAKELLTEKK